MKNDKLKSYFKKRSSNYVILSPTKIGYLNKKTITKIKEIES